jgi:hypothetical protein
VGYAVADVVDCHSHSPEASRLWCDIDRGMPPIRYALLHDFAYLNKCEVLGCDDWGELISKSEAELTSADLALLDQIAALTTQADTSFEELRALFAQTVYGQAVREQMAVLV